MAHDDLDKLIDGKKKLFRRGTRPHEEIEWYDEDAASLVEREERMLRRLEEGSGRGLLRSLSSYGLRGIFSRDVERKAIELVKIRNFVMNLLKIHGLPPPLDVRFSVACPTAFYDGTGKTKRVVLGAEPFGDPKLGLDNIYEIYGGMGLHECEHGLSSKHFIRWLEATRNKFEKWVKSPEKEDREKLKVLFYQKCFYNLLEDCRIETKIVSKSPGFDQYLYAMRKYIFGEEAKRMIEGWESMTPREKFLAIVTITLRFPTMLTDELKEYEEFGWCPYQILKEISPRLRTWSDVQRIGDALLDIFLSLSDPDEYEDSKEKAEKAAKGMGIPMSGGGGKGGGASEDSEEEPDSSSEGDSSGGEEGEDRKDEEGDGAGEGEDEKGDEDGEGSAGSESESKDEGDSIDDFVEKEKAKRKVEDEFEDFIKKIEKEVEEKKIEESLSKPRRYRRGGEVDEKAKDSEEVEKAKKKLKDVDMSKHEFDMLKVDELLEKSGPRSGDFDTEVMKKLASMIDEKFETSEDYTSGDPLLSDRSLAFKQPILDSEDHARVKKAERIVAPYVGRAGNVFRLRLAEKTVRAVDRREGRLFRRRLSHATVSERLFYKEDHYRAVGMSICLLLDESGSMGGAYIGDSGSPLSCGGEAFCLAIMLKNALKKVPRVDLHIYSHSSYGPHNENVLIKQLYGGERLDDGIGGYVKGCQNYDHLAIRWVGDKFRKQAKYGRQLLFYLADGLPEGYGYHGSRAISATRKEVQNLEKKGMMVICLGVGGHDPKRMFKHSIPFKGDFSALLGEIRKVIGGKVLEAGMEAV